MSDLIPNVTREGISAVSNVCAFLGGLFFSALLLIFQQKASYQTIIIPIPLFPITALQLIAIPLTISIILLIFSAVVFGMASAEADDKDFKRQTDLALTPFVLGLGSFFVSFAIVLLLVDLLVALIGIFLSIGVTVWWIVQNLQYLK
ncbi:hypothetical protein [Methanoregula sp.]|uniref:hypothetical protein n=1 Tax=Methanoregula sp. TaxID=2052170 RepID=UPI003BB00911